MENFLKLYLVPAFVLSLAFMLPVKSNATVYSLGGTMNSAQEVPTNNSPATGVISGTYNDITNVMSFTVVFNGLLTPSNAAHFHGPANPGVNAPVIIGWTGFPFPSQSGTYSRNFTLTDAQEILLFAGQIYSNIHTDGRPGGEIRAQMYLGVPAQIKVIMAGFYNTSTGRLNMKDTVRAYLRGNSSPYNIIDSSKSVIDSVSFTGNFLFPLATSGTYYIQIKHRNSVETWSRSPGQPYTLGSVLAYDFTDSISKAYGSNMIQRGGKFCIFSGDITQNGTIDGQDLTVVDNDAFNFVTGYISSDVNGDNQADAEDLTIVDNGAFNFVGKVTPP